MSRKRWRPKRFPTLLNSGANDSLSSEPCFGLRLHLTRFLVLLVTFDDFSRLARNRAPESILRSHPHPDRPRSHRRRKSPAQQPPTYAGLIAEYVCRVAAERYSAAVSRSSDADAGDAAPLQEFGFTRYETANYTRDDGSADSEGHGIRRRDGRVRSIHVLSSADHV